MELAARGDIMTEDQINAFTALAQRVAMLEHVVELLMAQMPAKSEPEPAEPEPDYPRLGAHD